MSQASTKTWNTIGWIATALVVVSIPFALIDPVMGIFVLYAAIVVGGLSGIGVNAKARFGIATIVASLLLGLIGTHYTSSTGLRPLELTLVWTAFAIFAIPILVSATLLLLGLVRRRYSDRPVFDS